MKFNSQGLNPWECAFSIVLRFLAFSTHVCLEKLGKKNMTGFSVPLSEAASVFLTAACFTYTLFI